MIQWNERPTSEIPSTEHLTIMVNKSLGHFIQWRDWRSTKIQREKCFACTQTMWTIRKVKVLHDIVGKLIFIIYYCCDYNFTSDAKGTKKVERIRKGDQCLQKHSSATNTLMPMRWEWESLVWCLWDEDGLFHQHDGSDAVNLWGPRIRNSFYGQVDSNHLKSTNEI